MKRTNDAVKFLAGRAIPVLRAPWVDQRTEYCLKLGLELLPRGFAEKYPNEVTVAVVFSDDEDESIGYARCTGKPVTKLGDLAMFEEPGEEFALGGFKVPIGWHPDTLIACLGLQRCELKDARVCFSYGIEVASYVYAK
jgi:hypothetical protein